MVYGMYSRIYIGGIEVYATLIEDIIEEQSIFIKRKMGKRQNQNNFSETFSFQTMDAGQLGLKSEL